MTEIPTKGQPDAIDEKLSALDPSIDTTTVELLNAGGWANGDVYKVVVQGRPAVIKTYAFKPPMIRWIGRILINREFRAYQRLAGLKGIPEAIELADPWSLGVEFIESERISDQHLSDHGDEIIPRLQQLIEDMHQRRVYHMDLRNQGNIMIDKTHQPFLLDFASAVLLKRHHIAARWLENGCRRFDHYGLSKWVGRAESHRQGNH